MEIYQRIKQEGERVFRDLEAQGVGFEITPANSLRINAPTTAKQFETIRLWKAQIVESVSPKCRNCNLVMRLIGGGKLWLCPLGCTGAEG